MSNMNNDELIHSLIIMAGKDPNDEEVLMHYGVKGMKWGVIRWRDKVGKDGRTRRGLEYASPTKIRKEAEERERAHTIYKMASVNHLAGGSRIQASSAAKQIQAGAGAKRDPNSKELRKTYDNYQGKLVKSLTDYYVARKAVYKMIDDGADPDAPASVDAIKRLKRQSVSADKEFANILRDLEQQAKTNGSAADTYNRLMRTLQWEAKHLADTYSIGYGERINSISRVDALTQYVGNYHDQNVWEIND